MLETFSPTSKKLLPFFKTSFSCPVLSVLLELLAPLLHSPPHDYQRYCSTGPYPLSETVQKYRQKAPSTSGAVTAVGCWDETTKHDLIVPIDAGRQGGGGLVLS